MTDIKVYLPKPQFIELQSSIAEAILYAQMIDQCYYIQEDDDGNETYTDQGQEEFNERYEQAEFILTDGGIWPDG